MGWGSGWFRPARSGSAALRRGGSLGLDVNAGRARAVVARADRARPVPLEGDGGDDLPLAVALATGGVELGRAAARHARVAPHTVFANYLPALGRPRELTDGRTRLDPQSALQAVFERLRAAAGPRDFVAAAVPAYLSIAQIPPLLAASERAKFPVQGTAAAPLALAGVLAELALSGRAAAPADPITDVDDDDALGHSLLDAAATDITDRTEVIRLPGPNSLAPAAVPRQEPTLSSARGVVIDADDHALTVSSVGFDPAEARLLGTESEPRLGVKAWKERLLDGLADRCVRLCRRDPRDAAPAEQGLWDQLDDALERCRFNQRASLTVRSTSWIQDLSLRPEELEGFCSRQAAAGAEAVREAFVDGSPRAVWFTHEAGRLPGLLRAVERLLPAGCEAAVLHPDAVAQAVAQLGRRMSAGELPLTHLDTAIPLPGGRKEFDPFAPAEYRLDG